MQTKTPKINKIKPIISEQPISINEFKSWIAGVEDMQGLNWFPTHDQWIKIRAKIDALVENRVNGSQIPIYRSEPQIQPLTSALQQLPTPKQTESQISTWNQNVAPPYKPIDIMKTVNEQGEYTPPFM
jgi:hypothetical protein